MKTSFLFVLRALPLIAAVFCVSASWGAEEAGRSIMRRPGGPITNENKVGQRGIGFQGGNIIGPSVQYWYANNAAINAAAGAEGGNSAISVSHNWMFPSVTSGGRAMRAFVPYAGAGAITAFGSQKDYFNRGPNDTFAFAAHFPLGLEYLPLQQRFDLFAQIAPTIEIVPVSQGLLTADVGARFFF